MAFLKIKSAVNIVKNTDGALLSLKRTVGDSDYYTFVGGKIEKGETPLEASRRELEEETGLKHFALRDEGYFVIGDTAFFFLEALKPLDEKELRDGGEGIPCFVDEEKFFSSNAKSPYVEKDAIVKERLECKSEGDIVKKIREGKLPAQFLDGVAFAPLRITGTGLARRSDGEFVWRDRETFIDMPLEDLVAVYGGVPVIIDHPSDGRKATSEYLRNNTIGAVSLPFKKEVITKGDEEIPASLWAVCRIFRVDLFEEIFFNDGGVSISTSPLIRSLTKIISNEGVKLVSETNPKAVNHLALVNKGVWDYNSENKKGV